MQVHRGVRHCYAMMPDLRHGAETVSKSRRLGGHLFVRATSVAAARGHCLAPTFLSTYEVGQLNPKQAGVGSPEAFHSARVTCPAVHGAPAEPRTFSMGPRAGHEMHIHRVGGLRYTIGRSKVAQLGTLHLLMPGVGPLGQWSG